MSAAKELIRRGVFEAKTIIARYPAIALPIARRRHGEPVGPDTDLVIEGHTDNTGKKKNNQKLSEDRAQSVIAYLTSAGVASRRMTGRGYADDRPVADNATEAGRKQNRRVEVQIQANETLKQQAAGKR